METRVLNYFLTIAKLGTISSAARELHVAQPTLSRQLQQLEEQLGTPLFSREKHRMVLTKAGLAYQLHVQQILVELNRANELVKNINDDELVGKIGIGAVESTVTNFLTPILMNFHQENPSITYDLYDADGTAIQQRLDQGLIELGFVSSPINTAKYHFLKLPTYDRWGIAVLDKDPLIIKKSVTVDDVIERPLIIPHRQLVHDDLMDWLHANDSTLNVVGEYNLLTNAIYLAAAGLGNLICIEGVQLPQDSKLRFIPFTPEYKLDHYLIWRKGVPLSEATQTFVNYLKSQISVQ
ncbi:LysR family transcriptional regulator [Companilactobacillus sp.]|jgi:DNA-binding transcriptional LysR family regulator|uniref:LysR family transcriptional regulator n=1 Tax=Companilactobacillus sp. TaxID=2767905 RepID=UPI0025BBBB39|nr:LysR family transcriptional regulator [Companilactobacillus sp.]MCH4009139.1 LysR family transcriptional regulator [Companilactobacillus sp.]MCH4050682.1 LysR family transcriptional regulator [Companilactobacillus sp.]MCH4077081.1 LysR family transcriptional regulator [Companilactobacillus sp.]MCH4125657.1 LysR family transcriptional regulator [Companilactobacillus sp.]MCI1311366.1 LysR family transcriptional regulator [Companilactobacillus sp.]